MRRLGRPRACPSTSTRSFAPDRAAQRGDHDAVDAHLARGSAPRPAGARTRPPGRDTSEPHGVPPQFWRCPARTLGVGRGRLGGRGPVGRGARRRGVALSSSLEQLVVLLRIDRREVQRRRGERGRGGAAAAPLAAGAAAPRRRRGGLARRPWPSAARDSSWNSRSVGSSVRSFRLKIRRNSGVVPYSMRPARPPPSCRGCGPAPRSSSVFSTGPQSTPRMSSISGRVIGLAVGDDRQRLEHRARQALRPPRDQLATQAPLSGCVRSCQPPATLDQLDARVGVPLAQRLERRRDLLRRRARRRAA